LGLPTRKIKKEMDLLSLKRTLQAVVICGILLLMFLVAQTAYRDFMESNIASLQKEQEKREAMLQEWQYKAPLADITRCG
ncbi:hypothetical protein AB2885_25405, partial [Escherichia coli]